VSAHDLIAAALPALAAVVTLGVTAEAHATDATRLHSDLQSLARRSVLFGHQSVGMNVLDGVARLAAREGVVLKVVDVTSAPSVSSGTFSHAFEPENGKPEMKLQSFARRIEALSATPPELALVKFCYVDFDAGTDAAALFARYQATLADLRRRSPGITFVHVTVPLTTVQGGAKAFLKRLGGGTPYGLAENARRDDYNQLVRRAYRGHEPLFDLAELESTRPDGGRETVDWKGRAVPALAVDYASDDGHLNNTGQERAAAALLAVLASARP
jgi:hypothetical protein